MRNGRRQLACHLALLYLSRRVLRRWNSHRKLQSKLPLLGQIDGCSPYFCLGPQTLNYLIDDQPLDFITLAYDYAPNTDERHMNQVLDKMLGQCGLTEEAGRTIYSNQKLKRTELRRVGKIKGRNGAAYWDAWATRDKGEFGHSTYMVTVYTKDGIKDNVDDFASSKLGIPKTTKPASQMKFCRAAH